MKRRVKKANTKKRNKRYTKKKCKEKRYTKKRYNKKRHKKKMRGGSYIFENLMRATGALASAITSSRMETSPNIEVKDISITLEEMKSSNIYRIEVPASKFVQINYKITDLHENITLTTLFSIVKSSEDIKENISIGMKPRLHDGPAFERISSGILIIPLDTREHDEKIHDFELLIGNTIKDTDTPTMKKEVILKFYKYKYLNPEYIEYFQKSQVIPEYFEDVSHGMDDLEPEPEPEPEPDIYTSDTGAMMSVSDTARQDPGTLNFRDTGGEGGRFRWLQRIWPDIEELIADDSKLGIWLDFRVKHEFIDHPQDYFKYRCYEYEYPSDECIYFNRQTDIEIVREVLSREAEPGSNVYLHIDNSHGVLTESQTYLNKNLHLVLTTARGYSDRGAQSYKIKPAILSIMKRYLDNDGHNNLFDKKGCMTLNGARLFYSQVLLTEFNTAFSSNEYDNAYLKRNKLERKMLFADTMSSIISKFDHCEEIRLSQVLKEINDTTRDRKFEISKEILFRNLKLYEPNDEINDTLFLADDIEQRRRSGNVGPDDYYAEKKANFGLTILYTNSRNENKYIHLPLDGIQRNIDGNILLSQIINEIEPLTRLDHKFFLKHGSCRPDIEYYKNNPETDDIKQTNSGLPIIYDPHHLSLTREISTPKERVQKDCFIDYFEGSRREEVRNFLSYYPTLIDYYVWLNVNKYLDDYINTLIEHGEGSERLYLFISEHYSPVHLLIINPATGKSFGYEAWMAGESLASIARRLGSGFQMTTEPEPEPESGAMFPVSDTLRRDETGVPFNFECPEYLLITNPETGESFGYEAWMAGESIGSLARRLEASAGATDSTTAVSASDSAVSGI